MKDRSHSLTEGTIWKGLLYYALPILLGNIFQQLYNTADTLIVGRYLDKTALAAVGSSGSLIFTLIGFFNGLSMGAGVLIARFFGAKDDSALSDAVHTDVALGLCIGALLTVVGTTCTPTILRWMGTPENVLPQSVSYFRFYFLGSMFIVGYNVLMGILQAVGDSRHPLVYLMISSVVNVLLDLLFVGLFRWGVWSAALATTISQGLSTVLALRRLLRTDGPHRLFLKKLRLHRDTLLSIVRLGLPAALQNSINAMANVVVQSNINRFGDAAMAGCGAYFKIEGFGFLAITCFAMGMATFVSQNLGAKQYDRAKKGVRFGLCCSVLLAEAMGIAIFLLAPKCMQLFSTDPEIIAIGTRQARMESLFYCVLAFSHCSAGILRGAGKPAVPMFTIIGVWCVLRIAYITVCMHIFGKLEVVFTAYPVTWTIAAILLGIYLLRADWLHGFDAPQRRRVA